MMFEKIFATTILTEFSFSGELSPLSTGYTAISQKYIYKKCVDVSAWVVNALITVHNNDFQYYTHYYYF